MIAHWRRRARSRRPGGGGLAVAGSVALHAVVVVVLAGVHDVRPMPPPVYRVNLVAAPAPDPDARRAPEAVERPADRAISTARARRTSVSPTPPPPTDPTVPREPAPRTTAEAPLDDPATGGDLATVKTEGLEFPYPAYLSNVVAQIYRRWNRPTGNQALRAEILFLIHRDGSISSLQFVQRSGHFAFDLEAQGAIEAAGTSRAFGPLPEGYPADVLPINFFFDPRRR